MAELDIGTTITLRRKALGMTQKQLADKLNVTDKAVSKWERNQGYPDITMLNALAGALDISVGDLLGGQPGGELEDDSLDPGEETVISNTLNYADKLMVKQRTSLAVMGKIILTAACLVGIITCFIVDMAVTGTVSWSIYPLASILFGWVVIMPLLQFRRHRFAFSLLAVTVFVLPLLYVIAMQQGGGWFYSIALPTAVMGLVFLWLTLLIFVYTKLRIWYKLALVLVLAAALDFGIDLFLGTFTGVSVFDASNMISVLGVLLLAGFSALLGVFLAKRSEP